MDRGQFFNLFHYFTIIDGWLVVWMVSLRLADWLDGSLTDWLTG
jgi:hypothetical protein